MCLSELMKEEKTMLLLAGTKKRNRMWAKDIISSGLQPGFWQL